MSSQQREVYRSVLAPVLWWVWLAFAVANLADLALQGRQHFSAVVAAVVVFVTGVMYALAFRPRVVADEHGITLLNPLREHRVPWGAVTAVDLSDTLQVHAARPGGRKDKVLYSWAVQSSRRSRARAELRAVRSVAAQSERSPGFAKLPPEVKDAMGRTHAELTARALDSRAAAARAAGQAGGTWTARWAWPSIAAMALPAAALVIVALL